MKSDKWQAVNDYIDGSKSFGVGCKSRNMETVSIKWQKYLLCIVLLKFPKFWAKRALN